MGQLGRDPRREGGQVTGSKTARGGAGRYVVPVLIGLLFLTGMAVMLYPVYSNLYFTYLSDREVAGHAQAVDAIDPQQAALELDRATRYNAQHAVNAPYDAFSADSPAVDAEYDSLLNPHGDGAMGYLEIPAIGQKLMVYHGTSAEVLDKGIGHLRGTSLPVGGKSTHCVLSGHRGVPSAKLFTDLDQLRMGDVFSVCVYGEHFAYEVEDISVVKPEELSQLAIQPGRDLMTLVTCTPYAVNTHRLLVRGHRVDYVPEEASIASGAGFPTIAVVCALSLAAIVLLAATIKRSRRKRDT